MTEERTVPRYPDKTPCPDCGDKGYIRLESKNGDSYTTPCKCVSPKYTNDRRK